MLQREPGAAKWPPQEYKLQKESENCSGRLDASEKFRGQRQAEAVQHRQAPAAFYRKLTFGMRTKPRYTLKNGEFI